MTVTLCIEGGGDNRRLGAQFRECWTSFFEAAGLRGRMPKVIRGGSREQTFDRFARVIASPSPEVVPLLLVDSESPVIGDHSAWRHLREHDGWRKPAGAGEDDAFLMVQVMETWFLADRNALRYFFGPRFLESALGDRAELEQVPKTTVLQALRRATRECSSRYSKGKVSFELPARIDPALVEAACPHARALLDRLRGQ